MNVDSKGGEAKSYGVLWILLFTFLSFWWGFKGAGHNVKKQRKLRFVLFFFLFSFLDIRRHISTTSFSV